MRSHAAGVTDFERLGRNEGQKRMVIEILPHLKSLFIH